MIVRTLGSWRGAALLACLIGLLASRPGMAAPDGSDVLWYRTLGVEDGLSQSFITAAVPDGDGFMWFGTLAGLDRWDGYGFRSYRHVPGDSASLSDSTVLAFKDKVRQIGERRCAA